MNEPPFDQPAHPVFEQIAQHLVDLATLKLGDTVLVFASSGEAMTTYVVVKIGPTGKVTPFAKDTNPELYQANLERLHFPDATFDCVLCSSGLFRLPDMAAGLREWRRVLKPGGTVAFSGYAERSFQPLVKLFDTCLRRYAVNLPPQPFAWQQFTDLEAFSDLLRNAAFSNIDVRSEHLGCYLTNAEEWWDLLWSREFCEPLRQLTPAALSRFKTEHLAAVAELATVRGIRLNMTVVFAVGKR